MSSTWSRFYEAARGRPPRDTLLFALERFEREAAPPPGGRRLAVDLGCGDGRDTVELLQRGWGVVAIDGEDEAIARLLARADLADDQRARLDARVERFEDARWPRADLVNASFSLPFCPPERFAAVWARIVASLRPGGRFTGQLFGPRDEWAPDDGMTFLARDQLERLLAPFRLERFDEVEEDGTTALGRAKRWHVFHVVAQKR